MSKLGVTLSSGLFSAAILSVLIVLPAGLVPDGTWVWERGLWAVGVGTVLQTAATAVVAALNPDGLKVRKQGILADRDKGQPTADKIVSVGLLVSSIVVFVFPALDVFWLRLAAPPPPLVSNAGGIAAILGLVIAQIVVLQNKFAAPNVQDQSEFGQELVDSGLYATVRHPMYTGFLIMMCGLALWLESYVTLAGCAAFFVLVLARMRIEEMYLSDNLDGYKAYMSRVRYRLIPYVF